MISDPERDQRVRQALAAAKLDAVVCRLPENVVCLTGYYPQVGLSFVVYPAEGETALVAPRNEREQAAAGLVGGPRVFEAGRPPDPARMDSVARLLGGIVREKKRGGKAIGWEASCEALPPSQFAAEPYVAAQPTRRLLGEL